MIQGNINSIETFGAVDGPGVRYIVFLQGCRMRCQYCHNPETWGDSAEGSYRETPAETFRKAWRYHSYWKNGGGITVSGGEALLQMDYVTELFRLCKEKGVHTALDTSGQPFSEADPELRKFDELMKVTDLFLLDLKQIDIFICCLFHFLSAHRMKHTFLCLKCNDHVFTHRQICQNAIFFAVFRQICHSQLHCIKR